MVGNMYKYRAVKRDGLWFLQERTFYIFWNDVYVKRLLMCSKSYLHLILTLRTTLKYGEIKGIDIVDEVTDKVFFKERDDV